MCIKLLLTHLRRDAWRKTNAHRVQKNQKWLKEGMILDAEKMCGGQEVVQFPDS